MADDLQPNSLDRRMAALRAVAGAVPFAGSLLCELIRSVVPNQRLDRIAKFASRLEVRIESLESIGKQALLEDPEFVELIEEAALQAIRATSDDRIDHLAALLANGMTDEQVTYSESRHLLRMLGELSDVEVIWLRSLVHRTMGPNPFYEKHSSVLAPVSRALAQPWHVYEKGALQDSYRAHLERLGLAKRRIRIDRTTKLPEYDTATGEPKTSGYELTVLGQMLLRVLGFDYEEK